PAELGRHGDCEPNKQYAHQEQPALQPVGSLVLVIVHAHPSCMLVCGGMSPVKRARREAQGLGMCVVVVRTPADTDVQTVDTYLCGKRQTGGQRRELSSSNSQERFAAVAVSASRHV